VNEEIIEEDVIVIVMMIVEEEEIVVDPQVEIVAMIDEAMIVMAIPPHLFSLEM
jgi:hypothetical protein